jgi:AsmA protein
VTMTGQLDDDPSDAGVDIDLKVSSNDISTLGLLSGKPLPAQPLELKANFSGSTRDFVIRNLSGSLGDSYLDATLDVSLSGSKPTVKLVANSKYINVAPFINTDKSEEQQATGEPAKDRLIPATPLPLDLLNSADVDIKLNIAELKYTQDSLKDFKLDIDLQAGVLQVQDFSFNAPGGTFSTTLLVQPTDTNNANVKLDVSAEDFIFNLKGVSAEKLKETPTFDVEIHVNGRGSDLQKLAASTNGYITLKSPGGLLEGVDLSILDTFILDEVFSLLMPKSDQPTDEQLSCAAAVLSIKNGLIKTTPAVAFTTEKITIVTKGTLDLKTEKMNFNFNATPNNALQISAGELFNPYILISGTLAKPAVGLDPAKALLHGGAAIGTAGISILAKGLLDRVGNASPVCEEMLKAPPPQG